MLTIPRTARYQILRHVPISSLINFSLTCKKLSNTLTDDLFWHCKVNSTYPNAKIETTWKQLYRKLAFDTLCLFTQNFKIACGVTKICSQATVTHSLYFIDIFDRLWVWQYQKGRPLRVSQNVQDYSDGLLLTTNGLLYRTNCWQQKKLIAENVIAMESQGEVACYINSQSNLYKLKPNNEVKFISRNVRRSHMYTHLIYYMTLENDLWVYKERELWDNRPEEVGLIEINIKSIASGKSFLVCCGVLDVCRKEHVLLLVDKQGEAWCRKFFKGYTDQVSVCKLNIKIKKFVNCNKPGIIYYIDWTHALCTFDISTFHHQFRHNNVLDGKFVGWNLAYIQRLN